MNTQSRQDPCLTQATAACSIAVHDQACPIRSVQHRRRPTLRRARLVLVPFCSRFGAIGPRPVHPGSVAYLVWSLGPVLRSTRRSNVRVWSHARAAVERRK